MDKKQVIGALECEFFECESVWQFLYDAAMKNKVEIKRAHILNEIDSALSEGIRIKGDRVAMETKEDVQTLITLAKSAARQRLQGSYQAVESDFPRLSERLKQFVGE